MKWVLWLFVPMGFIGVAVYDIAYHHQPLWLNVLAIIAALMVIVPMWTQRKL